MAELLAGSRSTNGDGRQDLVNTTSLATYAVFRKAAIRDIRQVSPPRF